MALRLNKTSKIIFALGIVILSGALGYLIWRVNQEESTAPEESEAGENYCNCCYDPVNPGSIADCDDLIKQGKTTKPCKCTYQEGLCENVPQCTVSECTEGSDCSEHCIWPQVNYCDRVAGGVCICKSPPNNCGTSTPCEISCPDGYSECTSGAGCETREEKCTCPDCKNDYYVQIKCKQNTVPSVCGNGTLNTGEECEVGNPTGSSCTWDSCNQTSCTCRDLTITKTVVKNCIDTNTDNPKAELTYTITMNNADTQDNRTITKVKDVLDSKILAGSITPTVITTPGAYSNGKIVWDYSTTNLIIKSSESKVLTYKVTIDKNHFGTYTNTVTMTRASGVTSQATATILADCELVTPLATCGNGILDTGESCELNNPQGVSCTWDSCNKTLCVCVSPSEPEPTVPQTGIFDSTLGRIGVGVALLIIGGVVYTIPNRVLIVNGKNRYKYREGFEKRVANR